MKLYSVFALFVVKKDNIKFICIKKDNRYIEFFTKKQIEVKDDEEVEYLSDYFSLLEVMDYTTYKPLKLTKKEILLMYIEINEKVIDKRDYYNANIDEILQYQDAHLTKLRELREKDPELAKSIAQKYLRNAGILDENNEVKEVYQDFVSIKEDSHVKIYRKD